MIAETLKEKILDFANSPLGVSINRRYTNRITINGLILQKPKFIKKDDSVNKVSCSFIIHQISTTERGEVVDTTYSVITYVPSVVDDMKKVDKCCFITCFGKLRRSFKTNSDTCHMTDFIVDHWLDTDLEPTPLTKKEEEEKFSGETTIIKL